MTQEELSRRRERAKSETLVIVETDDGYKVYSPANPATTYLVTGLPDGPACTCPDFEYHAEDPNWRCKHIFAVEEKMSQPSPTVQHDDDATSPRTSRGRPRASATSGPQGLSDGPTHMVVKRSVSPDGRIDSLSIEVALPMAQAKEGDIKDRVVSVLRLQDEIIAGFRKSNGNGPTNGRSKQEPTALAQLLSVGASNTRFGRRLFINVKTNGKTLKLFGSNKQLAEAVASAGFPERTDLIEEGASLDLPCRVTTKPSDDGKYLNVDRVFPAETRH